MKFDAIFDSLSPVGGMLTGDKVKPVLLNSKLPVDVLGRVSHNSLLNSWRWWFCFGVAYTGMKFLLLVWNMYLELKPPGGSIHHYCILVSDYYLSLFSCFNVQPWTMMMNWCKPLLQVWELSDIDRDGMLDKDEFAVVGPVPIDTLHVYTLKNTSYS